MENEKWLDLINRGELLDSEYLVSMDGALGYVVDSEIVRRAKRVDAVEAVHARWEDEYGGAFANPRYRCSVCKEKALYRHERDFLGGWHEVQALTDYCPNCGAKMDGERREGE